MTRRRHSTCHLHHSSAGVCSDCLRHRLSLLQSPQPNSPIESKQSEDESTRKSMKEHIDLEFYQPRRKTLWSASAFTDKLQSKWKFSKKKLGNVEAEVVPVENRPTVVTRRRSCDSGSGVSSFYEQRNRNNPNNVETEAKNIEKRSTAVMRRRSCDTDFRVSSVFDHLRLKQCEKKNRNNVEVEAKNIEKTSMRRRSCDTDFRVSSVFDRRRKNRNNVEAEAKDIEKKATRRRSCDTDLRALSAVDEPARASWDGYMIARTIPRLAPMLSVIENAMMNEQMLMEDFETNSVSESSSSQRRYSFDCSSSGKSSSKHRAPVEIDHVRSVLPVAKIVVEGDMGFDLYKGNAKNTEMGVKNSDSFKRKMLKIMGFRSKSGDPIGKNAGVGLYDLCNKSPNIGENSDDKSRSVRYSSSPRDLEIGLSRFHLKPSLSRSEKPERKNMLGVSPG